MSMLLATILATAALPEQTAETDTIQESIQKYYYNEGEKQRLAQIQSVQDQIKREKALPDTAKHKRAMRKAERRSRNLRRMNQPRPGTLVRETETRTRGERRKNLHKLNTRLRELEEMKGKYRTRLYLRDLGAGTAGILHCTIPEQRLYRGQMVVPAHTAGVAIRIVQVIDSQNLVALVSGGEYEDKVWFSGFATEELSDGDKFPRPGLIAITGERRDHLGDLVIVAIPFVPTPYEPKADKTSAP